MTDRERDAAPDDTIPAPPAEVQAEAQAEADAQALAGDDDDRVDASLAERRRKKEQKRLDVLTWTPKESTAVLYEDMVLGNRLLQRNFNLWFSYTQIAMYQLQQYMPNHATDAQSRSAGEVIESQLQTIERELADEYQRLQATATGDGITDIPAKAFTNPVTLRVPVFAPGAARVLRLLRRMEDMLWLVDVLFISGAIKIEHKMNLINRWKRLMWGLVRGQRDVWIHVRGALEEQRGRGKGKFRAPRKTTSADVAEDGAPAAASDATPAKKTASKRKTAAVPADEPAVASAA